MDPVCDQAIIIALSLWMIRLGIFIATTFSISEFPVCFVHYEIRWVMLPIRLIPEHVEFLLLSFEGPDPYSKAGGLGVRISNLGRSLASLGYPTHLIFIGSPELPGFEEQLNGRLKLYRWCQWISRYHPLGVYDGEEGKLADFIRSAPPFIIENIALPAIQQGRHFVVLAEEWHTAEALIRISDQLHIKGLRHFSTLMWNANNTKGFDRIDWDRLNFVATLTTVSRYMKQIMRANGLDPLIVPNGIPSELLQPPPNTAVSRVRQMLAVDGTLLLFKIGRYDPDKCWLSAFKAAAQLKQAGHVIHFLCRGGIEGYGSGVLQRARELGLIVKDVEGCPGSWDEALDAIEAVGPAEVYNLRFSLSQSMLHVFYAAADFVLANSKHEPFGLVGLEAMAAGGIVITGPTGETYSSDREGAIALDTEQPGELVLTIENLCVNPGKAWSIRQAAPKVAARYTWESVIEVLFEKIILAARHQNTEALIPTMPEPLKPFWEEVKNPLIRQPDRAKLPLWSLPVNHGQLVIPENVCFLNS
jgi:glycosyltransferase involved in cell wall biosynthesis